MELREFIKTLPVEDLESFAMKVGTTVPHLRNVAYKQRVASAALAAQIQVCTQGKVQVSTLRPKDWHLVWGVDVNQTMNRAAIVADGDRRGLAVVGEAHDTTVSPPPNDGNASQTTEERV